LPGDVLAMMPNRSKLLRFHAFAVTTAQQRTASAMEDDRDRH
jgi:hypothetical protein